MDKLKQMKRWVCWNYSYKQGRDTKVPRSVYGGETGSDEGHSATWGTYDRAVASAKRHGDDGIGFVLPEGFFLLDIDDRPVDDPYIQTFLNRFDSYPRGDHR